MTLKSFIQSASNLMTHGLFSLRMASVKKRRKRRKDARPAELIEAAFLEFAANGYDGARLDDVAMRAGVVKGTIYRYFDDKEALFLAVVQSRMPTILEPNDTLISSFPGTTRELLTHLLQFMYGKLVDSDIRILMRIILSEGNKFPELVELYHREAASKGLSLLQRVVARGVPTRTGSRSRCRTGRGQSRPRTLATHDHHRARDDGGHLADDVRLSTARRDRRLHRSSPRRAIQRTVRTGLGEQLNRATVELRWHH